MRKNNFNFVKENLCLDNDELMLNETLFHNANGYIGVRSNFEEGYPDGYKTVRGEYINGFYDFAEMNQAENLYGLANEKQTILNVADTQSIRLFVENKEFSLFAGHIISSSRVLDMQQGITIRNIIWDSPDGKTVEITIKRMTSFELLPLFTIEYAAKAVNFSGCLRFCSAHEGEVYNYFDPSDPRVAGELHKHLNISCTDCRGGVSLIVCNTAKSNLTVASAVKNIISKHAKQNITQHENGYVHEYEVSVEQSETVTLTKYTVLCDSIRYDNCGNSALKTMSVSTAVPLHHWYEKQKDYLTNYWNNCEVQINGDDDLSLAITYNSYQLIQSVGKDRYSNISAKGLSGEGYEGHYFWDTEMYILPFFSLTMPKVARNLLEFRYNILDAARENARIMGHENGALYAWRTIMGKECSGYYPSGSAQYHINGDIAYSVVQYFLLTKDIDFIICYGAEIVIETARLWLDVGNYSNDKFVINDVTGPDEYTCIVNNNYYTNLIAQFNLIWAAKLYKMLKAVNNLVSLVSKIAVTEEEIKQFELAANNMYLPYDNNRDINPQDDSFLSKKIWNIKNTPAENFPLLMHYHPLYLYRHQVCKQADTVLAHFIFEDAQKFSTMKNSYEYYEKITTHDSSLSTCVFSIMASRLHMNDKAYYYFGDSAEMDIHNTHKNTKDGIHTANMGGTYMAVVYGFTGLRVKESGISFSPMLPEKWTGYSFIFQYENSCILLKVNKMACILTLKSGAAKQVKVYENSYLLTDILTIPLS